MDFNINDWTDLSAIVTVTTLPLAFFSLIFSYVQIKNQTVLAMKNTALSSLVKFSELHQETSALRRVLASRFERGDKSLHLEDCMIYYNKYWIFRVLEWDYFKMGLIPTDTYVAWVVNTMRHMINLRNLKYFDNDKIVEIKSADIFYNYALNDLFLRHPDCRRFYQKIDVLCQELVAEKIDIYSEAAFKRINKFVKQVSNSHRSTPIWKDI